MHCLCMQSYMFSNINKIEAGLGFPQRAFLREFSLMGIISESKFLPALTFQTVGKLSQFHSFGHLKQMP